VYGDIGTSPLYALRECFSGEHRIAPSHENVLGVLSLVFWSLVLVVTLKYHVYVLRLDNRGEGGILALMELVPSNRPKRRSVRTGLLLLGLFGAALLYGDGAITPAISVLSAVEGLSIATSFFTPYVLPLAVAILVALFLFQRRGTGKVGAVFGPVMLVWFGTLAILGISGIVREPSVLAAVNPAHALHFFGRNGKEGFLVLGAVFLVATGGEALYADMGHFGERPIQIDWFLIAGPSLLLNYFGQGALLISDPAAAASPFYHLAPRVFLYPLVVLATAATVIASQAIISGAFSLTRQASQLGYLPRVEIVHTSSLEMGQIYIPGVNWGLMVGTILLVLGFRTSSNLAWAYGVAVATTMVITTLLASIVSQERLGWSLPVALAVTAAFLVADIAFFGANIVKITHGGWFPLTVAAAIFTIMTSWRRGRMVLARRLEADTLPVEVFMEAVARKPRLRVQGTAVFMDRASSGTPPALLHNLKHNKALHERVVFLSVRTEELPYVSRRKRVEVQNLGEGFYRLTVRYGFMQDPDIPKVLEGVKSEGLDFPQNDTTYFLGRETLIPRGTLGMAVWRERLFAILSRNATSAMSFFRLPPNRVIELGAQIEL
jgi:KUP system potassium uptake protein